MSVTVFSELGNWLAHGTAQIWPTLETVLLIPVTPSQRMYWLFVLSSAALALGVVYFRRRKLTLHLLRQTFFSRRYWLNRSTGVDFLLLFGNSLIKAFFIVPMVGSNLLLSIWVSRLLMANFDMPPNWEMPIYFVLLTYTLVFFLVEDFSRFGLHMLFHKVPLLWRFHKVHHGATVLTPVTLYRIHPLEMSLYYFRSFFVFGLVSGVFVYLFGASVGAYDIMGVHALGFIFNAMGANLRHSHIPLGFGALERLFISPAQHQIHHSRAVEHHDSNFGSTLAVWDKLFGTLVYSRNIGRLRFGFARKKSS